MAKKLADYLAENLNIECIDTKCQKAMRIRPRSVTQDVGGLGLEFEPGSEQDIDLQKAQILFEHSYFVGYTFRTNRDRFVDSEMRIYQIQVPIADGGLRVLGTIVTDGEQNLVRYCAEDSRASTRALMRDSLDLICSARSLRNYHPA